MPTVLRVKGYEFFFRAGDCVEKPHVHVRGNGDTAKVWLDPFALARSSYNATRTAEVVDIVREYRSFLLGEWRKFCGS